MHARLDACEAGCVGGWVGYIGDRELLERAGRVEVAETHPHLEECLENS